MDQTGNSFGSNPASLKGKLQTLEVLPAQRSNKSRTSAMSSIITRRRSRSSEVRRTPLSQSSPWRLLMSRRVSATSWSASRRKCTLWVIQEEALQFPEGGEQPHSAADHLIEGRKDRPAAATSRAAAKNHRVGDASRQRGTLTSLFVSSYQFITGLN